MPNRPPAIEVTGDEAYEALYARAESLLGSNTASLREMALLAHDLRASRDAMNLLSFVWGRNARMMARAVARYPSWFMSVDGAPPVEAEADELLALFAMGALTREDSDLIFKKWRLYTWRAWQVRDAIEDMRTDRKTGKPLRVRLRDCDVDLTTQGNIKLSPNGKRQDLSQFDGRRASVTLTLLDTPQDNGDGTDH